MSDGFQCDVCVKRSEDCNWTSSKRAAPKFKSSTSSKKASKAKAPVQNISACTACRKKKQKCSGDRPTCQSCFERSLPCSYEVTEGMTRSADLKQKLYDVTEESRESNSLMAAMQNGTDEEASMLLARLRLGVPIHELLDPATQPMFFSQVYQNQRTNQAFSAPDL